MSVHKPKYKQILRSAEIFVQRKYLMIPYTMMPRPEINTIPLDQMNYALLKESTVRYQDEKFVQANQKQVESLHQGYYSALAGRHINSDNFTHSNMNQFVGSKNGGLSSVNINDRLFENYTGYQQPHAISKQEVKSMYDQQRNITTGMPNITNFLQERIIQPKTKNGVLPFQQEKVGPGIGLDHTVGPTGGYHQYEIQDYAKPKTIDDMRVLNKPKLSYESPIIDGQKGYERGMLPNVRFAEDVKMISDDYRAPNSAPFLKETSRPIIDVKDTQRGQGEDMYIPPGYGGNFENREGFNAELNKSDFNGNQHYLMNMKLPDAGYNYNQLIESIVLPTTLKEICVEQNVANSFIVAPIKAMFMPLSDAIRRTKKALFLMAGRDNSNLNPQIPSQLTLRSTDDIPRTTVKETTLHNSNPINLAGTIKGPISDTTQVAKTTIKETLIHDTVTGQIGNQPVLGYVYDPTHVARTTVKETLQNIPHDKNLTGNKKGMLRYANAPKVTIKETIIHTPALGAAVSQFPKKHLAQKFKLKQTNRQTTSASYYGTCKDIRGNIIYTNQNFVMRPTTKQITSLHQYFGGPDSAYKGMPDIESIENARTNEIKELLSENRTPNIEGSKTAVSKEAISLTKNKLEIHNEVRPNYQLMPVTNDKLETTFTKDKEQIIESGRIDPDVLSQLSDNPFHLSILDARNRKTLSPIDE
jgi:hypothetical protein